MTLCEQCESFDVRALLLSAASAPRQPNTSSGGHLRSSKEGEFRQAVERFHQHTSSLLALKSSAESCELCSAIWKQYSSPRKDFELTDAALAFGVGSESIFFETEVWDTGLSQTPLVIAVQRGSPANNIRRQLACFEVCAHQRDGPKNDGHLLGRLQASSSAHDECFDVARDWLKQCYVQHPGCEQKPFRFPTRVLDVGRDKDKAYLVQGDQCTGPYTALSYCWGGERDLMLLRSTEQSLRRGLPIQEFPGTLRDALIVARKLGLSYIWIDALCIFQDPNHEDWALEAARMRDVYRGAAVTIEAASASRASEGFLRDRPSSKPYCQLRWNDGAPEPSNVYMRPFGDITDYQLLGTKVYTRGWTLQERLLAPRTLSFGTQQLSFECAAGFVDESGRSTALPRATEYYLSKRSMQEVRGELGYAASVLRFVARTLRLPPIIETRWHTLFTQGMIDVPGGFHATYFDYWRGVIERFTERELTFGTDRLPALSGLANELQQATGDTYIAGLWRSELPRSLAWDCSPLYNVEGDYGPGKHPSHIPPSNYVHNWPDGIKCTEYIAPSWSWASVKGRITFFDFAYYVATRKAKMYVSVLGVDVTPMHEDPFGKLQGGHLDIGAPMLHVGDPFRECNLDYQYPRLHNRIYRKPMTNTSNLAEEIFQHHEPHDGQAFALIKLLLQYSSNIDDSPLLWMLLLESDGNGNFRRLCCVRANVGDVAKERDSNIAKYDDDAGYVGSVTTSFTELIEVAREIESAPWKEQRIRLV